MTTTMSANLHGKADQIAFWKPDGVQKYLATSAHFFVGLLEDGRTVLKYPHRKTLETLSCLYEEADRYARLGTHENLVTYKGFDEDGLLLEYCEGGVLSDLIESPIVLNDSHKTLISNQILSCLAFLHGRNYIHCDMHVRNIFLTSKLSAKVGDLQGQLYRDDGSIEMEAMSQEDAKSRCPNAGEDEFTPRTDIFAVGTLLYHLWHGHPPFPELDTYAHHDLIQARFRERQYPADMSLESGIDIIIGKCWGSQYERVDEIIYEMSAL
jgi:serine/threonine protein kinase